jgi:hypothetical protein
MQCFSIWYASWPDRRIGGAREIRRVPSSILNPVAIDSKIWFAHNQATAESKVSVRGRRPRPGRGRRRFDRRATREPS